MFNKLSLVKGQKLLLNYLQFMHKLQVLNKLYPKGSPTPINLMDMHFINRVGIGAGLDINGESIASLIQLDVGFVEFGPVSPMAQMGTPNLKPARGHNNLIIDGLNPNLGVENLVANLSRAPKNNIVRGVEIIKGNYTPDEHILTDLQYSMLKLVGYVDYVLCSLPPIFLEDLTKANAFLKALKATQKNLKKNNNYYLALVLKITATLDVTKIKKLAELLKKNKIDAVVACAPRFIDEHSADKICGQSIKVSSEQSLNILYECLAGSIPIIASGGVLTSQDIKKRIQSGADLVKIFSGLFFTGPAILAK